MEPQDLSFENLSAFLTERIRLYSLLSEEGRAEILQTAQEQASKGMPPSFILSSARALAKEWAAEAEETDHPPDSERQRFIKENALAPEDRVLPRRQPRSEAKAREREGFVANVRRILREARAAKQPHERKKLRRELMGIDQNRLRRVMGNEGRELSEQIREALLRAADLR